MKIGIPKEIKAYETRVALTPKEVAKLQGHRVLVQAGAGQRAGFMDAEYLAAGAELVPSMEALYGASSLIVKVKEPQVQEIPLLTEKHQLFCYLHLGGSPKLTQALAATGVTAYGFECLVKEGQTPLLAPMSRLAGRLAVQIGSWYLQATQGGRGSLLGGSLEGRSGVVTLIGAGIAGTSALELAWGMGAKVRVLDLKEARLERLRAQYPGVTTYINTPENLAQALQGADVLIGAVYNPGRRAVKVIQEEHLRFLPPGAVAVDIAVDQGGCFSVTRPCSHGNPVFQWEGIQISAIPNLPAAVPRTGSINLGAAILPYLLELAEGQPSKELQGALNLSDGRLKIEF